MDISKAQVISVFCQFHLFHEKHMHNTYAQGTKSYSMFFNMAISVRVEEYIKWKLSWNDFLYGNTFM